MTSESTALPTGGTETTISADTDRTVPPAAATLPALSRDSGIGSGVGKGRRPAEVTAARAGSGPDRVDDEG